MNEQELSTAIVDISKELRDLRSSVAGLTATNDWQVDALKRLQNGDDAMLAHCSGQRQAITSEIKVLDNRITKVEEHVRGVRRWGILIATALGGLWAMAAGIVTWMNGGGN
jgi:phage shock protein A